MKWDALSLCFITPKWLKCLAPRCDYMQSLSKPTGAQSWGTRVKSKIKYLHRTRGTRVSAKMNYLTVKQRISVLPFMHNELVQRAGFIYLFIYFNTTGLHITQGCVLSSVLFFAHCTCPEFSLWLTVTNLWERINTATMQPTTDKLLNQNKQSAWSYFYIRRSRMPMIG